MPEVRPPPDGNAAAARHPCPRSCRGLSSRDACRSFDDVGRFYKHVHTLHAVLSEIELAVRLEPGDALLIDNHRVMHGRHAFRGHRR